MICPKCGQESLGNYCSNCGEPLYFDSQKPIGGYEELINSGEEEYLPRTEKPMNQAKYQAKESRGASRARRTKSKVSVRSRKERSESKKEMKKRENRIKKLEHEVQGLRDIRASHQRGYETGRKEGESCDSFTENLGQTVSKGAEKIAVTASRLMQMASFFLMAGMVWVMAISYWQHGQDLGELGSMVQEQNFGLALYVGTVGVTLLAGMIWCLWILTKKGAGGGVRLKRYDTGRGFFPFLLCLVAVLFAAYLFPWFLQQEQLWRGAAKGGRAVLNAVYDRRQILFFFSGLGAALSLVRKILSV